MPDEPLTAPEGPVRYAWFGGLLDGRRGDDARLQQAVADGNRLGLARIDLDLDGGRFTVLFDDNAVGGDAMTPEKAEGLLAVLNEVVAASAEPGGVESTLRCTEVYADGAVDTLFTASGGAVECLSRPRELGAEDRTHAPREAPPLIELPRMGRRQALGLLALLLVTFGLLGWRYGVVDIVAGRSADALDFNEFQQRFAASFNDEGGLGDGPFPKSKESWIPFASRMDMIRRDLKVAKTNIDQCAVHEEALARNQPRTTELDRAKAKAQYGQKKQLFCALCEQPFELINLPFSISYKAVLDLRKSRGWKKPPGRTVRDGKAVPACYKRAKEQALLHGSPGRPQLGPDDDPSDKMAAVPRCYDQVRACRMCSQWFEDADGYRPTEGKQGLLEDEETPTHHMSD